jgi:hypothetical protein
MIDKNFAVIPSPIAHADALLSTILHPDSITTSSLLSGHMEITPAVLPGDYSSKQTQESTGFGRSIPAALSQVELGAEANNRLHALHSNWNPQHFATLKTLGKGNYATVYLVESLQTKELYAMKTRSKRYLDDTSEQWTINTEKTILLLAKREKHPFIVEVFGGFQTQLHILIYIEFCQGGNLMHHLTAGVQFCLERTR